MLTALMKRRTNSGKILCLQQQPAASLDVLSWVRSGPPDLSALVCAKHRSLQHLHILIRDILKQADSHFGAGLSANLPLALAPGEIYPFPTINATICFAR